MKDVKESSYSTIRLQYYLIPSIHCVTSVKDAKESSFNITSFKT